MRLLRKVKLFYLRVGAPGSLGRWAARNAARVRQRYPHLTEAEVARALWRRRYAMYPPRRDSREGLQFLVAREQSICGLLGLCSAIMFVEMDLRAGDGDLYDLAMEAARLELDRTQFSIMRRQEGAINFPDAVQVASIADTEAGRRPSVSPDRTRYVTAVAGLAPDHRLALEAAGNVGDPLSTADGVPISLGMLVYHPDSRPARVVGFSDGGLLVEVESKGERSSWWRSQTYSSAEAAGFVDDGEREP